MYVSDYSSLFIIYYLSRRDPKISQIVFFYLAHCACALAPHCSATESASSGGMTGALATGALSLPRHRRLAADMPDNAVPP